LFNVRVEKRGCLQVELSRIRMCQRQST